MMRKVLFYTNIPSPYRVDFFNELGKYCDLTVLFEIDSSTERDANWKNYRFENFHGIIMKGIRTHLDRAFCPGIIKYLKRDQYDVVVVSVLASATSLMAVAWMKLLHISYCYEGDGASPHGRNRLKEKLKRFVIKDARLCFSPSQEFDKYCIRYGAKDNIVRYPFTSLCENDILPMPVSREEKMRLKESFHVSDKRVLIGVGMIRWDKGWDILISALECLDSKWKVFIVGGAITPEYSEQLRKLKLTNVEFVDFLDRKSLREYYRMADVFCLPTRHDAWGLVINEAMANGLPVITTRQCTAGVEMITDGENGFLYECEDVQCLKSILKKVDVLFGDDVLEKMGEAALEVGQEYTIENMVKAHLDAWKIDR